MYKMLFDSFAETVSEPLVELLLYIERTFITGVPARGRRRSVQPRFSGQTWIVYSNVLHAIQRTTDSVERWRSKFKKN